MTPELGEDRFGATSGSRVSRLRVPALSEVSFEQLRLERLERLQSSLRRHGLPVCLLYNPGNIRYATGVALMDVWAATTFSRHCLVPAEGSPILFEYGGAVEQSQRLVDDVRPMAYWQFEGVRAHEVARRWAAGMRSALRELGLEGEPLAVDKLDTPGWLALQDEGIRILDVSPATIDAREIKTGQEIALCKINGAIGDAMLAAFEAAIRPGVREYELLAVLADTLLRYQGEAVFSRLVASGTNTNPWLREASDKVVMPGDIVAVDTDANGYEGYVIDVSRTFLCGERPTPDQQDAYRAAYECVVGMAELVRPGTTFEDFCYAAPRLPERYRQQRYSFQAHQAGLEDEGPFIPYPEDVESGALSVPDRELQEGMVLCLECYAGEVGAPFGVKLEDQLLVTADGCELLSTYPFDATLLGGL
jgi:Xaa-Pro aminopeptidase